jgi:hypothetical protein
MQDRNRRQPFQCVSPPNVDRGSLMFKQGYLDDDYPHQLPLDVPLVALTTEDSEAYSLSDFDAYGDWRSTDLFPGGNGFVRLGPNGALSTSHDLLELLTNHDCRATLWYSPGALLYSTILTDEFRSRCRNVPPDALSPNDQKRHRAG